MRRLSDTVRGSLNVVRIRGPVVKRSDAMWVYISTQATAKLTLSFLFICFVMFFSRCWFV